MFSECSTTATLEVQAVRDFAQERFSVVTGNYYRNSDGQALSDMYMGLAERSPLQSLARAFAVEAAMLRHRHRRCRASRLSYLQSSDHKTRKPGPRLHLRL